MILYTAEADWFDAAKLSDLRDHFHYIAVEIIEIGCYIRGEQ